MKNVNDIYRHAMLDNALLLMRAAVNARREEHLIYLLGASRVGKTSLLRLLCDHFEKTDHAYVRFEAPSKLNAQYSWKPFLIQFLDALGHPLANLGSRRTSHELLDQIYTRIQYKGIKTVIIDDADFLASTESRKQLNENLQNMKKFVNHTRVKFIYAGTGELQRIATLEAQGILRSSTIYLEPYSIKRKTECSVFRQCVVRLNKKLLVPLEDKLLKNPKILHEYSMGCIGVLWEILMSAESIAKEKGTTEITSEIIEYYCRGENAFGKSQREINRIRQVRQGGYCEG